MSESDAGKSRSAPDIHPTAIVAPGAQVADGAIIGPYAIVEDDVSIGAGTRIGPHAVIHSHVSIGADNIIHAHAVIGGPPQDIKYDGSPTRAQIGDRNVIREGATVHRASSMDRITRIGSDGFFMAYSHVGHDCLVGDHVILTNNVALGGHVQVDDRSILGGGAMVHQFCRIGTFAMVAGFIAVRHDVIPYTMVAGSPVRHYRLNTVGLRRAGVRAERYRALEAAFRALRDGDTLNDVEETPEIAVIRSWLQQPSKRGCYPFAKPD